MVCVRRDLVEHVQMHSYQSKGKRRCFSFIEVYGVV